MAPLAVDVTGNQLTYRIIGAAMRVHNQLGPGLKEEVYEKALWVALTQDGITAQRQVPVSLEMSGEPVGLFYLDLLAEDTVVIEIKARIHLLTDDELAQVINYLKAADKPLGLLFNFGRQQLEYKRIFPPTTFTDTPRLARYLKRPK